MTVTLTPTEPVPAEADIVGGTVVSVSHLANLEGQGNYPVDMFPDEYPDGFGELYDLRADPWEMRNLYFDAEHAEVVREMRSDLLEWLVVTSRPVTSLAAGATPGYQSVTRYHNSVNLDGKLSPERIRAVEHKNYI